MSKVIVQAIAEAAGVPVPTAFKSGHLFSGKDGSPPPPPPSEGEGEGEREGGGLKGEVGGETVEAAPTAELAPERDAVEEIVAGRCEAVLIVPRDARTGAAEEATEMAAATAGKRAATVVLRDGALVRAALPRGATVVLPGSYNPLHRGHLGLLEAARRAKMNELESIRKRPAEGADGAASSSSCPSSSAARGGGVGGNDGASGVVVHGVFEVSVANVDKGGLAAEEVRRRAEQFSEAGGVGWPYPVAVTRAPLFSQKVCVCVCVCVCVFFFIDIDRAMYPADQCQDASP